MRAAGIDVGKADLDLAVDDAPGVARFANNRAGIAMRMLPGIVNARRREEPRAEGLAPV